MNFVHRASVFATLLFGSVLAIGCSASSDDDAELGDDQEVVPESAKTLFDQAAVCDKDFERHKAIKEVDLHDGLLRWTCGDVPGVTGKDLGQEYCEYHAVQGGKVVAKATDLKDGQKLSCVFTSVYADVKPTKDQVAAHAQKLATALEAKENLATKADPNIATMHVGFNSRGAATALIGDCSKNANAAPKDEERQAACWEASIRKPENAAKLKTLCRGKNLNDEKRWASVVKLGAKVAAPGDENYEWQRDRSACLRTAAAQGVTWRNSDPMICTRVTRAVNECKATFNAVPDALDGFIFTGWVNRGLPPGCRKAKVDGKDYDQLVLCDATAAEAEDISTNPAWAADLNMFCKERFGNDLVMMAPLRALEKPGTKADGAFCSLYTGKSSSAAKE